MLRKIENHTVSEDLQKLLPQEPSYVVLGDSVFEMDAMTLKEAMQTRTVLVEAMKSLASGGELSIHNAVNALVEEGILTQILQQFEGITEELINKITVPQMLHAATVWITKNFLAVPGESLGGLLEMYGFFASMSQSTNESEAASPIPTETTSLPTPESTQESTQEFVQVSPSAETRSA